MGENSADHLNGGRLDLVFSSIARALREEAKAMRTNMANALPLGTGVQLDELEHGFLYRFRARALITMPVDTPIYLTCEVGSSKGTVIAQQDRQILLFLASNLGGQVDSATVTASPAFIYQKAAERLRSDEISERDLALAEALLNMRQIQDVAHDNTELRIDRASQGQQKAVKRCLDSQLHFVWGPPGTGKTHNLTQTCHEILKLGQNVMVLAHSNVAVDAAMIQIAHALSGTDMLNQGRILRIGHPQVPEVRHHPHLRLESIIRESEPELIQKMEALEALRAELTTEVFTVGDLHDEECPNAWRLLQITRQIAGLESTVQAKRIKLMDNALVIGCTLSKFVIDAALWKWKAQNILVDEASMAPFPFVLLAAFAAQNRLHFFGDFKQLSPVHLSSETLVQQWLGRDVYAIAGIKDTYHPVTGDLDPRVTLLEEQFRMNPAIGDVVSAFAYDGRLRHHPSTICNTDRIRRHRPFANHPVVFIDTTNLKPICYSQLLGGSYSRATPVHAVVVASLAKQLEESGCHSIAIVSPYRAQAQLISEICEGEFDEAHVVISTVHRFQGSEADAVILDLCDSDNMSRASNLTGGDPEVAQRLLNVALSRARGKLLVVGNHRFVVEKHLESSPAKHLLAILTETAHTIVPDAHDLNAFSDPDFVEWLNSYEEVWEIIRQKAGEQPRHLTINIPDSFTITSDEVDIFHRGGLRKTVFAPLQTALLLEDTDADLRLLSPPSGFFACFDDKSLVLGGEDMDGSFALIQEPKVASALMNHLLTVLEPISEQGLNNE